jgi:hypothetical protein
MYASSRALDTCLERVPHHAICVTPIVNNDIEVSTSLINPPMKVCQVGLVARYSSDTHAFKLGLVCSHTLGIKFSKPDVGGGQVLAPNRRTAAWAV